MSFAAPTRPFRRPPKGLILRNVELFASGEYRGKTYTVPDIDEIAENFHELGPEGLALLDPTAVLGHEETQQYLERTDLPAAGWIRNVRVKKYHEPATGKEEAILIGDIAGVPPAIAKKITHGQYRKVSAEIYSDFTDDFGNTHGKALRRVAILGAEVPQVKRIADLPLPETYAERHRRHRHLTPLSAVSTGRGTVLCFAEPSMNRSQMIQALMAAMPGLQQSTLDGMTDDALADLSKNVTPAQPVTAASAMSDDMGMGMGDQQTMSYGDDPSNMTRDELISELSAAGQDPSALQGMSDDDLKNLYAQQVQGGGSAQMGDPSTMTREELIAELSQMGEDPASLANMSDDDLKNLYASQTTGDTPAVAGSNVQATPMSEHFRRVQQLQTMSERTARRNMAIIARQHRELKLQDATAFCEQLVREGKILPATKGTFIRTLLRANNVAPTQRFSEKGKTIMETEYESLKREYSRFPALVRFHERVQGASGGEVETYSEDREVQYIHRFNELHPNAVRAAHGSVERYVEKFREAVKKKPKLKAVEYGVPEECCR